MTELSTRLPFRERQTSTTPPRLVGETSGGAVRPGAAIAWVWAVALLLSLYGAEDVQLWVRTSAGLGDSAQALAAADSLASAGRATRLSALHRALEGDVGPATAAAPPPAAPPPSAPPAGSAPGSAPASPGSTPAAPAPRPVHRVLLVGASSIQFHLGVELERELSTAYAGLKVQRLGKLSTGLTRPDVFDWPAQLRALMTSFQPDVVVANFGGNDAQSMLLPDGRVARFGSPDWDQTYRARLQEIVGIGRAGGASIVLMSMSTTRDKVLSRRMAAINALMEQASQAAGARYLSIWDLGADRRGQYQEVARLDGVPTKTRLADGKHFSRAGAAFVAAEIARRLAAEFALQAAGGDLSRAK